MMIVDNALKAREEAKSADPRRHPRRRLHGPGPDEPDREQHARHADGGDLQPQVGAGVRACSATPAWTTWSLPNRRASSTMPRSARKPVVDRGCVAARALGAHRRAGRCHRLGRVRRAGRARGVQARQGRRADERRDRCHDRPDPADVCATSTASSFRLRRRRAGRADEPLPLGQGSRPDAARDRQHQGTAGSVPQPDHAERLCRAVGAESGDGHQLRRRLEDQLRAGDRRQRHRLQGAAARHVARAWNTAAT